MKKINVLVLAILIGLTVLSCSSDDEKPSNTDTDLIIGNWHPISEKKMLNGVEVTQDWTCGEFSTYSFMENGEFAIIEFIKDDNGNCVEATYSDSHMYKNYWENVGKDEYKLTSVYTNDITSETKTEQYKMLFTNNNNTMTALDKIDPNKTNYYISTTFIRY